MPRNWELKVESRSATGSYALSLGLRDSESARTVGVVEGCGSLEEFEKELAFLKLELDGMLREARDIVRRREESTEGAQIDPPEIWRKMEQFGTDEEMFSFFNSLDGRTREKVADFVMTQVSMFRGRGPLFAEHYDTSDHTLE